jgi:hypothetical protein
MHEAPTVAPGKAHVKGIDDLLAGAYGAVEALASRRQMQCGGKMRAEQGSEAVHEEYLQATQLAIGLDVFAARVSDLEVSYHASCHAHPDKLAEKSFVVGEAHEDLG